MKKTRLQAIVLVAVGAFLGFAAASGRWGEPTKSFAESTDTRTTSAEVTADAEPTSCTQPDMRQELLALAAHNNNVTAKAAANGKKPNILVIWGDDIGTWNISHNNRGMMGYKTPNIDRIAKEGLAFTDYYAQQSCTAGRAAFISGSVPVRSGMTKVGMPGAKEGWQKKPTSPWPPF